MRPFWVFAITIGVFMPCAKTALAQWEHLRLGQCYDAGHLEDEVSKSEYDDAGVNFVACLRGRIGAEITSVSGTAEENLWIRYARGSSGLFLSEWMSLHLAGRLVQVLPLGQDAAKDFDRTLEVGTLQFGNPGMHHFWVGIGRMQLPFGIDRSGASQFYRHLESRQFWDSPSRAVSASLDNKLNLRLDLGYASNEFADEHALEKPRRGTRPDVNPLPLHALSSRLMYDIPALDGSRLIASAYGEDRGRRRFGFGFLTISRKGDETQFEFIHILDEPSHRNERVQRLVRLGYVGAFRDDSRWVVQFDDERLRARMGTLGYDFLLWDHLLLRFSVAHYKSELGDQKSRWSLSSGIEARL